MLRLNNIRLPQLIIYLELIKDQELKLPQLVKNIGKLNSRIARHEDSKSAAEKSIRESCCSPKSSGILARATEKVKESGVERRLVSVDHELSRLRSKNVEFSLELAEMEPQLNEMDQRFAILMAQLAEQVKIEHETCESILRQLKAGPIDQADTTDEMRADPEPGANASMSTYLEPRRPGFKSR
eukprot:481128_1